MWTRLNTFVVVCSIGFVLLSGCRTPLPMAKVNLSEPGWMLRQGQAVWRAERNAPEIAGDFLLATHQDGRTLLQFTKTPLPFVTVQTFDDTWQIEFVPQKRRFHGSGIAPPRLSWVHLARAFNGRPAGAPWEFQQNQFGEWRLENPNTGEMITGFLSQ